MIDITSYVNGYSSSGDIIVMVIVIVMAILIRVTYIIQSIQIIFTFHNVICIHQARKFWENMQMQW